MMSVSVTITGRRSAEGHPFSEIHYTFKEDDGPEQYALTRLWYAVSDTVYERNHQSQQFIKRWKVFTP